MLPFVSPNKRDASLWYTFIAIVIIPWHTPPPPSPPLPIYLQYVHPSRSQTKPVVYCKRGQVITRSWDIHAITKIPGSTWYGFRLRKYSISQLVIQKKAYFVEINGICYEHRAGPGEEKGGVFDIMHGRSYKTIDLFEPLRLWDGAGRGFTDQTDKGFHPLRWQASRPRRWDDEWLAHFSICLLFLESRLVTKAAMSPWE